MDEVLFNAVTTTYFDVGFIKTAYAVFNKIIFNLLDMFLHVNLHQFIREELRGLTPLSFRQKRLCKTKVSYKPVK